MAHASSAVLLLILHKQFASMAGPVPVIPPEALQDSNSVLMLDSNSVQMLDSNG
jgi:hypothetical protein